MSSVAIKGTLICYRRCLYLYVYVGGYMCEYSSKSKPKERLKES